MITEYKTKNEIAEQRFDETVEPIYAELAKAALASGTQMADTLSILRTSNIVPELIYRRSQTVSVWQHILPVRKVPKLEHRWVYDDRNMPWSNLGHAEQAAGERVRLDFEDFTATLNLWETKFAITDMAKIKGLEYTQQVIRMAFKRMSEQLAKEKDDDVMTEINSRVKQSASASAKWTDLTNPIRNVAKDINTGLNYIAKNSNATQQEMRGALLVAPMECYSIWNEALTIGNDTFNMGDYTERFLHVTPILSRNSSIISTDAYLIIPGLDAESFGYHMELDPPSGVPMREFERDVEKRTDIYTFRDWFGTVITDRISSSDATSYRIYKISTVA